MDFFLVFITGIVATTLGTLAGGGGLISLPVMLLLGVPIHSAIGANKVSNTISSYFSFLYLLRKKELDFRKSVWIIPVSLFGGVAGGAIAAVITSEQLSVLAIILLVCVFISSFLRKTIFKGDRKLIPSFKSVTGVYGIGLYDGLFGPGQGTLMLYLFSSLNLSYINAVGLVRLATFSSCFGAAITYIAAGSIIWSLTISLMAGSWLGAQLGVRVARKIKPAIISPILKSVTFLLILQLIFDQL
ncbi:sulfite exporter TauE/SafE family protein [Jeotgalibacillus sp. R-1-5s-1]|uniref:sulfite exporter TauE/SafE family protein n=1 Tax=Jeotgalibacillus sp. R-1-5s-1 TaxID=2555897 RepID=UPI0010698228|nr:sulfite exporter TauE/SafE family protein [Jeotgalibacillus sp. R-1-5s-1]TFE00118.1 sulfite exporter TauE/SafE family protein [Jeotgalibacillus sp. R-1-5s-1]